MYKPRFSTGCYKCSRGAHSCFLQVSKVVLAHLEDASSKRPPNRMYALYLHGWACTVHIYRSYIGIHRFYLGFNRLYLGFYMFYIKFYRFYI